LYRGMSFSVNRERNTDSQLGGIVAIAIVVTIIWLLCKRRKNKK
jgi:hypothetical protein